MHKILLKMSFNFMAREGSQISNAVELLGKGKTMTSSLELVLHMEAFMVGVLLLGV